MTSLAAHNEQMVSEEISVTTITFKQGHFPSKQGSWNFAKVDFEITKEKEFHKGVQDCDFNLGVCGEISPRL